MFDVHAPLGDAGTLVGALPGLSSLFDAVPDAILVVDEAGKVRLANPAATELFGYPADQLPGLTIEELVPEELRAAHRFHRGEFAENPHLRAMGTGLRLSGRRADGTAFPIDASLTPLTIGGQRYFGAFVRDMSDFNRVELLLLSLNQINRALLASLTPREIYALVSREARQIFEATLSTVVIPGREEGHFVVAAADDEDFAYLVGLDIGPGTSEAGRAIESGMTVRIRDLTLDETAHPDGTALGLGPSIVVPLSAAGSTVGALSIVRSAGQADFNEIEQSLAEIYASAVAAALITDRTRNHLAAARLMTDKTRIAHDLADVVISALAAIGSRLENVASLISDTVRPRVTSTVAELRMVSASLEHAIEDLRNEAVDAVMVSTRINEAIEESVRELGFEPALSLEGAIDSSISLELRSALLEALGEILHNIACHAMASQVTVAVTVDDFSLVLSIADDGVGIPEGPASARWLNRLATRAREYGGELSVVERRPMGCLYEWRVALA